MPSGRRKAGAGPSPSDKNSSDDSSSTCSDQRGRGDHSRGSDDSMSDVCSRERVKGNRWLKPEKFDGRGSFETFMYMFENCATYNNWGKKDKLAHLRWSMTGMRYCSTTALGLRWSEVQRAGGKTTQQVWRQRHGRALSERPSVSASREGRIFTGVGSRCPTANGARVSGRKVEFVRTHCQRCLLDGVRRPEV